MPRAREPRDRPTDAERRDPYVVRTAIRRCGRRSRRRAGRRAGRRLPRGDGAARVDDRLLGGGLRLGMDGGSRERGRARCERDPHRDRQRRRSGTRRSGSGDLSRRSGWHVAGVPRSIRQGDDLAGGDDRECGEDGDDRTDPGGCSRPGKAGPDSRDTHGDSVGSGGPPLRGSDVPSDMGRRNGPGTIGGCSRFAWGHVGCGPVRARSRGYL